MARHDSELSEGQVLNLAFEHVGQLARLLHAAGHPDLAALLDGLTDVEEIRRRRLARGEQAAGNPEVLGYVLEQLGDLAALMDQHERPDTALLLRFPGQFVAARQERSGAGDPFHPSAEANDAP